MVTPENAFPPRLQAAAAALAGLPAPPESHDLLRYLGYDDGDATATAGRVRMLRAAALFRRLFRLPAPDAPGLVFFGAEADPATLGPHNTGLPLAGFAGSGLDPGRAFEACVGEGIEYLSQFAQPNDPLRTGTAGEATIDPTAHNFVAAVLASCRIEPDRSIDWIPVRRLERFSPDRNHARGQPLSSWPGLSGPPVAARTVAGGQDDPAFKSGEGHGEAGGGSHISSQSKSALAGRSLTWFPADLCLRRPAPDFVPPLKLSTGCAAGPSRGAATLRALLELIERDAVALWWRGGQRGRSIAPGTPAGQAAAALLVQLRRGQAGRQTTLLDITTDLGVPAIAAFSTRPDGLHCALGMAARTTLAEAARSAIFEMCQSELSLHVIAAKRHESGDAALNASDRRQYEKATKLHAHDCPLLQPDDTRPATRDELSGDPVTAITQRLGEHGITAYALDLTRSPFDVPVIRVIAPGLQYEPCEITGERLARTIAETGGGAKHSAGIALL